MHNLKKLLLKILAFTMITVLILSSTIAYAATQEQTDYGEAAAKLKLWGIINDSDLKNSKMTRELFSKLIINSTGNYELAKSMEGSTTFSDVSVKSEYCGYINAAARLGYLQAYSDGKYRPSAYITFAQLCTAMVKALGYTQTDITGAWPTGYIEKAKNLGLTDGTSLAAESTVSTADALAMLENMLNTNIKNVNSQSADQTLLEVTGLLDEQDNWVYGKPEVAFNFKPSSMKLGSITFKSDIPILRDTINNATSPASKIVGETIALSDIKDKDVVYQVYNKLNVLKYYLVVDNRIDGEITSILPSKYSPKKVQINNVDYELGQFANLSKFNSTNGSFNVGDSVTAVLGYDGKIVDAYYTDNSDVEDYAFVVNTSTNVSKKAADYGKLYYTVDLMKVDGTTKTYRTADDPGQYRWTLVKYSVLSDDYVALLKVTYNVPSENHIIIDRYERKIGQSYITDNIKIFNYTDSNVSLLKWSDIPNGTLPSGKVQYIGTTGEFGDVNIIVTSDVLNQQYKNYVVQKVTVPDGKKTLNYSYNLVSGTTQYTYSSKTEIPGAVVGSVFSMKMYNNQISTFGSIVNPDAQGWYLQAIDAKRLKMGEFVYFFGPEVSFYQKDYSGNLSSKKLTDINVGTEASYGSIRLYCDRPLNNGGKVQYVIFSQN